MAKKKQPLSTRYSLLLLVGCTVLFGLASISSVYYRYKYESSKNESHGYPIKTWQAGEIIVEDRFAFSFNSARVDTTQIPNFWELKEGEQFVIVNVTYTNRSDKDFYLSPLLMTSLVGPNNEVYSVTSAPAIQDSLGGPVSAGQTVKGEIGFILPNTTKTSTLLFDPGIKNVNVIRVNFNL